MFSHCEKKIILRLKVSSLFIILYFEVSILNNKNIENRSRVILRNQKTLIKRQQYKAKYFYYPSLMQMNTQNIFDSVRCFEALPWKPWLHCGAKATAYNIFFFCVIPYTLRDHINSGCGPHVIQQ